MSTLKKSKFVKVGIDEAGRGPLAGPVSVGIVVFLANIGARFKGVKDSKKLSQKEREGWFSFLEEEKKWGNLDFSFSFSSNKEIDKFGISKAISRAILRSIKKLKLNPKTAKVYLDGSLKAPNEFKFQKTIIKGDEKVKIISLASIVAKVSRDRWMKKVSKKYKNYCFDIHKGYGTALHIKKIKKFGLSDIHRKSFIKF